MTETSLPNWAEVLFDEKLTFIAIKGGRGSAKSHSVAEALIIRAASKPLRILCTREIQKSIKASVKQLLNDKIKKVALEGFYTITDTEIRGKNGSLFLFSGLRTNPESIKSMEGIDICWVEEAHTVSQKSLDDLIPTIRKDGSQIIFTWNPNLATDPVDSMFSRDKLPPDSKLIHVNYNENPWFDKTSLPKQMQYDKSRDMDKYLHVWEGQYLAHSETRVFKNWTVDEFEAPDDAVHRFGADWGFSIDPTVLVRCHIIGRTLYIDYEAYMVGCEITSTPDLFLTVPESEKYPIVSDSARPETISYMRQNGFPKIMAAVKGAKSLEEGIEWLKSYDIVVHPRCEHTIDELTHYGYKKDPLTGNVLPILEDKHNHVIDALRYACESVRRTARNKPIEVTPLPTVNRW